MDKDIKKEAAKLKKDLEASPLKEKEIQEILDVMRPFYGDKEDDEEE